jgi:hypothetical protein
MIGYVLFLSLAIFDPATDDPDRFDPPKEIYRVWIHSVEEDTDVEEVYRPESYDFPPSRGREGFELKEKGIFIGHFIAPGDGTEKIKGRWKCAEKDVLSVDYPDTKPKKLPTGEIEFPPSPRTIAILSCNKNALKIKKPKAKPKKAVRE